MRTIFILDELISISTSGAYSQSISVHDVSDMWLDQPGVLRLADASQVLPLDPEDAAIQLLRRDPDWLQRQPVWPALDARALAMGHLASDMGYLMGHVGTDSSEPHHGPYGLGQAPRLQAVLRQAALALLSAPSTGAWMAADWTRAAEQLPLAWSQLEGPRPDPMQPQPQQVLRVQLLLVSCSFACSHQCNS